MFLIKALICYHIKASFTKTKNHATLKLLMYTESSSHLVYPGRIHSKVIWTFDLIGTTHDKVLIFWPLPLHM